MTACPSCGFDNPQGFRFCPNCGATLAPPEHRREERKIVTLLFADVMGSTSLGEQLDPERVRSLLGSYFAAMRAVIESWGGTVEKYIGDAVMAGFGVRQVREDDADRALRAALEMLRRLAELNADFEARHGVTLQIRIGVNTGEVLAPAGAVDHGILTGDATNVAARLEQAAEPGTILVGERTWLATRNAFRFDPPLSLALKGKAKPVIARRLLAALPEADRGVPGLEAPLVARDRELANLHGLMDEVIETARPRLVVVYGPAGIGKSRLVREFVTVIPSRRPGATVLRGRCLAAGRGITYWALGEILREACGISLDDPIGLTEEKLRGGVGEILAPLALPDEDAERTAEALAVTAGIPIPGNALDHLEPRAVADELGRAWPRFATALSGGGPTVFLIEDLHWAEPQLLDMVERIVARSSGPLLLVATARPEFGEAHPSFTAGGEDASSISLRPLTEGQSGELLEGLLAVADLPSGLRREILKKAEGNPFFLEEMIRRLIDEGGLVRDGDRWRATPAADTTTVPDTIHGLLAARIDALSAEEKRVLEEAAVVGRVFWEEPVARAVRNGEVGGHLLGLERKGLVFARPTSSIAGQTEYMFKHALVRDVAYAALPKSRRARAHAELAAWIEELAGDRIEEFAELLAYHLATAVAGEDSDLGWADDPAHREEVRRKALEAQVRAGDLARRRFALAKALELHERALSLADSSAERARAHEEIGEDHDVGFHGDEAEAAYRQALEIWKAEPPDTGDRARVSMKIARMATTRTGAYRHRPEPWAVDDLIRQALSLRSDEETRAWLRASLGGCGLLWRYSETDPVPFQERVASLEEAGRFAESSGRVDLQLKTVQLLRDLYWWNGSYAEALEASRAQLEILRRVDSDFVRASETPDCASNIMEIAGEYGLGLELVQDALPTLREMSSHELMHGTALILEAQYYLGRWPDLLPVLEEHLAAFEKEKDATCGLIRAGPFFGARALASQGHLDRARSIAGRVPPLKEISWAEGLRARLMVETGDVHGAVKAADEAIRGRPRLPDAVIAKLDALAELQDWADLERFLPSARNLAPAMAQVGPACDRAEGKLEAARGDTGKAAALIQAALDGFERLGVPVESARTREALAQVLDAPQVRAVLTEALGIYQGLGARPHAERIRSVLARGSAD
jgi:class 3 adenylate cyclase/tetratricopeptide (TPR) repeat protein